MAGSHTLMSACDTSVDSRPLTLVSAVKNGLSEQPRRHRVEVQCHPGRSHRRHAHALLTGVVPLPRHHLGRDRARGHYHHQVRGRVQRLDDLLPPVLAAAHPLTITPHPQPATFGFQPVDQALRVPLTVHAARTTRTPRDGHSPPCAEYHRPRQQPPVDNNTHNPPSRCRGRRTGLGGNGSCGQPVVAAPPPRSGLLSSATRSSSA